MPAIVNPQSEGLIRFSGMYGAAYDDAGNLLADVVEVSGAVEINRIEVPIVGATRQGYKPGRESREGTIRIHKVDTKWELLVHQFLSGGLQARRAARNAGNPTLRPFNIVFDYDDPDALGVEKWKLSGVLLWRLPLGFSITDDIVEREFPMTWESEEPIYAFRRSYTAGGSVAEYTTTQTPT